MRFAIHPSSRQVLYKYRGRWEHLCIGNILSCLFCTCMEEFHISRKYIWSRWDMNYTCHLRLKSQVQPANPPFFFWTLVCACFYVKTAIISYANWFGSLWIKSGLQPFFRAEQARLIGWADLHKSSRSELINVTSNFTWTQLIKLAEVRRLNRALGR